MATKVGWDLIPASKGLNKSNNEISGLLVPSKPWEQQTAFGANHLPIL